MDRRESTTQSLNEDWSICQYYFTHNNGSSDDVLLLKDDHSIGPHLSHRNKIVKLINRSYTYPQVAFANKHRKRRRWTTIKRHQALSTLLSDHISINNKSVSLEQKKYESIKLYIPQLDNEKVLYDNLDEEASFLNRRNTTTTATLYTNTSYINNLASSSSTRSHHNETTKTEIHTSEQEADTLVIHLPEIAEPRDNVIRPVVESPRPYYFEKKLKLHSNNDMVLFISGFLVFPIWWYGTYRYFTQTDTSILSKRQRSFQLLNYLFSIASLLVLGLVIGLVTVWA